MSDTKINNGGPAFPCSDINDDLTYPRGMTLRDWLAATIPLTPTELDLVMSRKGAAQHSEEVLLRYQKADAMLAARKEKV